MSKIFGLAGAGNTKTHQNVISELLYAFIHKSKTFKKYSKFKSLPEIGLENKIPDIVVYNYSKSFYTPIAIFEICYSNRLKDDIQKCNDLMNKDLTINESFVVDITEDKFVIYKQYRLKNGKISKPVKKSNFDSLNIDLHSII